MIPIAAGVDAGGMKGDGRFDLAQLEERVLLAATLVNAGDAAAVYDAAGALHVAYYDTAERVLKYAARSAGGAWDPAVVIDATPYAGGELSIALDTAGRPAVAYYEGTNRDLKFAQKGRKGWAIQTIDSAGTVGHNPSLAFTPDGFPLVSYYASSTADLRLASFNGTRWYVTTIDAAGSVGRFSDIAISPADGSWAIAYESQSDRTIRYAQKWGKSFTTRVIDTMDGDAAWEARPQLGFNATGNPVVGYVDNGDLVVNRAGRKSWTRTVPLNGSATSLDFALFVEPATGAARLLYTNIWGNFTLVSGTPDGAWHLALMGERPAATATMGPAGHVGVLGSGGAVTEVDPAAPSPLTLTATRDGSQVHLAWTGAPAYAHQLTLERLTAAQGDYMPVATLAADAADYWDAQVVAGTTYQYRLRVADGGPVVAPFWATATIQFVAPAPTLTATAAPGQQIELHWENWTSGTGYLEVERAVAGTDAFEPRSMSDYGGGLLVDSGEMGVDYVYRARLRVSADLVSPWASVRVGFSLPIDGVTLRVDAATPGRGAWDTGRVQLSWSGLPAGAQYVFVERTRVGGNGTAEPVGGWIPADLGGMTDTLVDWEGASYVYRIRVTSDVAQSALSTGAQANLPPAMDDLIGARWTNGGVTIGWDDVSDDEIGYRVERSLDDVHFETLAALVQRDGSGGYFDATAAERTVYYYRVTAVGPYAESAGAEAQVETGLRPVTRLRVEDLAVSLIPNSPFYDSKASFTLRWDDNSSRETHYIFRSSTDGVNFGGWGTLPAGSTSITFNSVTPDRPFWFKVHAVDESGEQVPDSDMVVAFRTPLAVPQIPFVRGITLEQVDAWYVSFKWDVSSSGCPATGYRIERSVDSGRYEVIDRVGADHPFYVDSRIDPGHQYAYRVVPFNAAGDGHAGGSWVWAPPVTGPTLTSAVSLSGSTLRVTWDGPSLGATKVQVHFRSPFDGEDHVAGEFYENEGTATFNPADDNGSLVGQALKVWLTSTVTRPGGFGETGTTAPSNALWLQTTVTAPPALTVTPVAPGAVDVTWGSVPGNSRAYGLWMSVGGGAYTQVYGGSVPKCSLTGLDPAVAYSFKVMCAATPNTWSDPVTAYPPPAFPANLTVTRLDDGRVRVNWDDPTGGLAGYTVSLARGNQALAPQDIFALAAGVTEYEFDAARFEAGVPYHFTVENSQVGTVSRLSATYVAA